jgi:hypothetical protein
MNDDELNDAERQLILDSRPWELTGEEIHHWIARQPELWDIDSKEAMNAAVSRKDVIVGRKAPDACGVYFLMTNDGGFRYVGKASSIRGRIADHHRKGRQFTHCWWIEMPLKAAELVEAYLIQHHRFPLNVVPSRSVFQDSVQRLTREIDGRLSQCP